MKKIPRKVRLIAVFDINSYGGSIRQIRICCKEKEIEKNIHAAECEAQRGLNGLSATLASIIRL